MRLMTFAAVIGFAASTAVAEDALAQLKIAVVNAEGAIAATEEFKTFRGSLEAEFADEQASIEQFRTDIQALQQRLVDERDVMAANEINDVTKEIEDKRIELEFLSTKAQKAVGDRQQEFFQGMSPKFQAVVNDLIELERYDFVYDRRTLLFANMKHDITAKVTEKLNERYAEQQQQSGG